MSNTKKTKKQIPKKKSLTSQRSKTGGSTSRRVGTALGTVLGSAVGGPAGAALGGILGNGAGALFKKITGFGDYKITSNSLSTPMKTDSLPSFTRSGRGTRIIHREYLTDVVTAATPGSFQVSSYNIQPGLVNSFPWLSAIANQFDEYQIMGMIFEFKSNSYDALSSTNTASGTVIMTTQYNVLAGPFTTKVAMEQYEFTCSAKPSIDIFHPIECARGESPNWTLTTRGASQTGDLRLYDFATFNLATVGMQGASTNIGELWVSYDINFLKPKVPASINQYLFWTLNTATVTSILPFGNADAVVSTNSNLPIAPTSSQAIVFPRGFTGIVLVHYSLSFASGTSAGITSMSWTPAVVNGSGLPVALTTPFVTGSNVPMSSGGVLGLDQWWNFTNGGRLTINITNFPSVFAFNSSGNEFSIVTMPLNYPS